MSATFRGSGNAVGLAPAERWTRADMVAEHGSEQVPSGATFGSFVARVSCFDACAFGVPPAEAVEMDPQQRLLLELSYAALHSISYRRSTLADSDLGVYLAVERPDWQLVRCNVPVSQLSTYAVTADTLSIAAGRLSYVLGLHGPCYSVDTACSSSITAVHSAALAIAVAECPVAVAESVSLKLCVRHSLLFATAGMLSPEGRCKTVDASADGFVRGEGCGAFVLRAVAEERAAQGRICSSAVQQDGKSASLTAPNATAQRKLLRKSVANAGHGPRDVGRVEMHGTGTALGDPTETAALLNELGQELPLVLGASKSNFGHMEPTAGMLGLLKCTMDLAARGGGSSLAHLKVLNPYIRTEARPVAGTLAPLLPTQDLDGRALSDTVTVWRLITKIVGCSSFGYSGTIGHLNLQRCPSLDKALSQSNRPRAALAYRRLTWPSRFYASRHVATPAGGHRPLDTAPLDEPRGRRPCSRTVTLEEVLDATQQVVGSSSLDSDAPFFHAGLDSLGATELASKLRALVGGSAAVPSTLIIDAPTARQLAQALQQGGSACATGGADAMPTATQPQCGWIFTVRDELILSDSYFSSYWYSFVMSLDRALEMVETSSSLRSSFMRDDVSHKWRWQIGAHVRLPVYSKTIDDITVFPFNDRTTPVFYERDDGKLWLNHACWDAFSMVRLLRSDSPTRHFSVQHERVLRLKAAWEGGRQIVEEVLRGPLLFDTVRPFTFVQRVVDLPMSVINMVQRFV